MKIRGSRAPNFHTGRAACVACVVRVACVARRPRCPQLGLTRFLGTLNEVELASVVWTFGMLRVRQRAVMAAVALRITPPRGAGLYPVGGGWGGPTPPTRGSCIPRAGISGQIFLSAPLALTEFFPCQVLWWGWGWASTPPHNKSPKERVPTTTQLALWRSWTRTSGGGGSTPEGTCDKFQCWEWGDGVD